MQLPGCLLAVPTRTIHLCCFRRENLFPHHPRPHPHSACLNHLRTLPNPTVAAWKLRGLASPHSRPAPHPRHATPANVNQGSPNGNTVLGNNYVHPFDRKLQPRVEYLAQLPYAQASGLNSKLESWGRVVARENRRHYQAIWRDQGLAAFKRDMDNVVKMFEHKAKVLDNSAANTKDILAQLDQKIENIKDDPAQMHQEAKDNIANMERRVAAYEELFRRLGISPPSSPQDFHTTPTLRSLEVMYLVSTQSHVFVFDHLSLLLKVGVGEERKLDMFIRGGMSARAYGNKM
ncbi:hypothetical protein DFH27DRAFT_528014 [Peziza echinospora]|nr:hypothetical protein DFH27DRAFT_528014 [Peziza echinospora]